MTGAALAVVLAALVVAFGFILITVVRNTFVCAPSEVLIFSGRRWTLADGKVVGFRCVRGGRAMRMPLIEAVDRMQLTNMAIELSVQNAFSRGGVPLNVVAVANIKIPSEEPLLHNALERFLGCTRQQIIFVAKDTLEGNLRGVIAELTPEEINQKKDMFQQKLIEEAHRDLQRLGLVLDNLQIQNISDEVGYLTSVGRVRVAQVVKNGKIGEVRAKAAAYVQKAKAMMEAELAKIEADGQVAKKENERRIVEARTQREALIAEARGQVAAQVAESRAQVTAWDARIEQIRRRLEADTVAPAAAEKQRLEAVAQAQAAVVLARGKAGADALASLAEAYKGSGAGARDALLLQKLVPVFDQLTSTMRDIKVDRLTVLGTSANGGSLGAAAIGANEQIRAATGVDLVAAAKRITTPAK
ncbi:MAG TPA: SPFH domain-containing protein [Haliangiales bacterium]|nr:SPFH domain-containing protein [Haliangiales bacterium]